MSRKYKSRISQNSGTTRTPSPKKKNSTTTKMIPTFKSAKKAKKMTEVKKRAEFLSSFNRYVNICIKKSLKGMVIKLSRIL